MSSWKSVPHLEPLIWNCTNSHVPCGIRTPLLLAVALNPPQCEHHAKFSGCSIISVYSMFPPSQLDGPSGTVRKMERTLAHDLLPLLQPGAKHIGILHAQHKPGLALPQSCLSSEYSNF